MSTVRRTVYLVLALLVAILSVSGIAVAQAADDGSLRFGTSTGGGIRMFTDVMAALKLDKKNGLEISWSFFPGPRGMLALMHGRLDVSNLASVPSARMALEGRHMQNFEVIFDSHVSFLVPPESKIKNVWELKGKRLGFLPRASATYTSFAILSAQRGINAEKYFKLIIGNPIALKTFLHRRDVDATMHFEPFVTDMLLRGEAKEVGTLADVWREATNNRPFLFVTLGASKKWLDTHPRTARKLTRAIRQTRKALQSNPDNIKHGLKSLGALGENKKVVEALKSRMISKIYRLGWTDEVIAAGRWQIEQAVKLGQLEKMPKEKLFVKFQ